ncbi:SH3 domain-containing protein [Terrisporobacter glycolicus]|uniref:SH3 domain-containing protein n=1 Tax=Terrisporobacter glycolicus TaxID=36841 RepID=UPI0034639FE4
MKNNMFKKVMITGLVSTVCMSGIFTGNFSTKNSNYITTAYAATIKETVYSAKGAAKSNLNVRKGPNTTYAKVGSLKKSAKVNIVAKTSNNWYKIKLNNGYGYVSSQYITITNNKPESSETLYSANGTANNNVNVRKGPNTTYAKVGSLKKNSKVTIVAKSSNNWYKIKFNSGYGYVSSQYITIKTNKPEPSETPYSANGTVNNTLNARKGPDTTYAKVGSLKKNSKVTIIAKTDNGWYKIKFNNGYAYVSSQFITIANNKPDSSETPYSVNGTANNNINVRKGPNTTYSKVGSLKKNSKVTIVAKADNGWYKIKFNSGYGYVSSQYITIKTNKPDPSETPCFAEATITDNINVRKGPNTTYAKIGSLKKNAKVSVVAKTSNNWYKIKFNNSYAYVSSQYVTLTEIEELEYSATASILSDVYVRKGPNTNYEKIGTVKKDEKVDIVAITSNGWSKIKYNNTFGYIYGEYVDILTK